jgi:hypothetical protein
LLLITSYGILTMAEFQRMVLRAFAIRLLPGFHRLFKITRLHNCGMFNVFVLLVVSRLMCLTLNNFSDLGFGFSEVAMVRLILVRLQGISDWLLLSITPGHNPTLQFASHWVSVFLLISPRPQSITSLLPTRIIQDRSCVMPYASWLVVMFRQIGMPMLNASDVLSISTNRLRQRECHAFLFLHEFDQSITAFNAS